MGLRSFETELERQHAIRRLSEAVLASSRACEDALDGLQRERRRVEAEHGWIVPGSVVHAPYVPREDRL